MTVSVEKRDDAFGAIFEGADYFEGIACEMEFAFCEPMRGRNEFGQRQSIREYG